MANLRRRVVLAAVLALALGCAHGSAEAPGPYFVRAQQLIKAGRLDEARQELRGAAPLLGPRDARRAQYFERLGYIAWLEKDVPNARNYFILSLREAGALGLQSDAVAQTEAKLALCHLAEGNPREAVEAFQRGLAGGAAPETRRFIEGELKKLQAR